MDMEKGVWRSAPFRGGRQDFPGLSFVDGGPTDNSGLAATIKGIQDKYRESNGEVPRKVFKTLSFATDYSRALPILFEKSPNMYPVNGLEGVINNLSPYPWIFDKYITLDHRKVADGGMEIITILAKTRDNPAWGIEKNWFF